MTRALKAAGLRQAADGESLDLIGSGRRERVWLVRDEEKYFKLKGCAALWRR
jgi:hypothetical protein